MLISQYSPRLTSPQPQARYSLCEYRSEKNEYNKIIGVWDFLDFGKKNNSLELGSFNMPAINFGF